LARAEWHRLFKRLIRCHLKPHPLWVALRGKDDAHGLCVRAAWLDEIDHSVRPSPELGLTERSHDRINLLPRWQLHRHANAPDYDGVV
jgi:hypothetical protein